MARVLVAMSGGVDSSVAAWRLCQMGHEVVGLFMRHGPEVTASFPPGMPDHAGDAQRMADRLGVEFHAVDFGAGFEQVIDYFVDEYACGRTPNPCALCNARLKFGRVFAEADRFGATMVATGHYARIAPGPDGRPALFRALHADKDQSYVLFGIRRELLPRLLFPNGDSAKDEIRRIAAELGFHVADKPDSQEICFVPDHDHVRFVREKRPSLDTSGELVTVDGQVVGRHSGIEKFTIGQRKGLGIAFGEPRFVVRIEADTRRVVIGEKKDLARRSLTASGANWLIDDPTEPFRCEVRVRYRSRAVASRIRPLADGRFSAEFDEPVEGVAPGQVAVCYAGDRLLGGGWIE